MRKKEENKEKSYTGGKKDREEGEREERRKGEQKKRKEGTFAYLNILWWLYVTFGGRKEWLTLCLCIHRNLDYVSGLVWRRLSKGQAMGKEDFQRKVWTKVIPAVWKDTSVAMSTVTWTVFQDPTPFRERELQDSMRILRRLLPADPDTGLLDSTPFIPKCPWKRSASEGPGKACGSVSLCASIFGWPEGSSLGGQPSCSSLGGPDRVTSPQNSSCM